MTQTVPVIKRSWQSIRLCGSAGTRKCDEFLCVGALHLHFQSELKAPGQFRELDFPKNRSLDDLMRSCTIARGQVMMHAQPENSLWAMKEKKALYAKMDHVSLEMKLGIMAKAAASPRWSISISYANSRSFGPLDSYIDALYVLSEPGVSDIICEVSCINHSFFLTIAQTFSSDKFVKAFLGELASVGISYEVMWAEPLRLCGIEAYASVE